MQSIRAYLKANPDKVNPILAKNRSFVFFRAITGPGPIGSQGVAGASPSSPLRGGLAMRAAK